jgi:asparagine synthase (glutamine-hydrolysing)
MCGILGVIPTIDQNRFQSALDRLAHRGPDGEGIWEHPNGIVTLGHRRLAIIDLKPEASQPMSLGNLNITFNGEIYNYRELRLELERLGSHFRTESDTEVLLAAYRQWKERSLDKLKGMWAFAIWNEDDKTLFLARDRFGEKPLFYSQKNNQFVFGSEMKALMALGEGWMPSANFKKLVKQYDRYESSSDTLVEGVSRFPAGHYGVFKDGQLKLTQYWDTLSHLVNASSSFEAQTEQFRHLFSQSVALTMCADVPVGAAISGGLDSSSVLGAACQFTGKDRLSMAFTANFAGSRIDESEYARQLASEKHIALHEVSLDPLKALANLSEDLYYFEEIYRTPPSPMMELYSHYRQQQVYVSVDGHGPDEMFSGYGNFMLLALIDAGIDPLKWKDILNTYENAQPDRGIVKAHKAGNHQVLLMQAFRLKEQWLDEKLPNTIRDEQLHKEAIKKMGYFNYALYQLFHYSIFPTLLRNYDRFSMRSGVEIRMPFLDPELVAFSFSIPWQSKIKDGYSKAILREAVRPWLPKSIVERKDKIGFQAPLADWMRGPWKEFLQDTIAADIFKTCELIDPAKTIQLLDKLWNNNKATNEEAEEAWLALSPYLWQQHFFNRAIQTP